MRGLDVPEPWMCRRWREGETGDGRGNDVECGQIGVWRISEIIDQGPNLDERSRPAVDEEKWDGIFPRRLVVHKVKRHWLLV